MQHNFWCVGGEPAVQPLTPGGVNQTTHAMLRGVAKVQDNRTQRKFEGDPIYYR